MLRNVYFVPLHPFESPKLFFNEQSNLLFFFMGLGIIQKSRGSVRMCDGAKMDQNSLYAEVIIQK